jgi:hypothetical protein
MKELTKERIRKAFVTKTPVGEVFKRIGCDGDGGYVVIDDFSNNDYLISMGIENNVSFEKELESTFAGMDLYDYSVNSLPEHLNNSRFFQEKVGGMHHHIFSRVPEEKDLILKIDIEGGEWPFFLSLSDEQMNKFRQIVVEIHWMIDEEWLSVKDMPIEIVEKINKTHQAVAVHPNNYSEVVSIDGIFVPQVIEITFARKSAYTFIDVENPANYLFQNNSNDHKTISEYL